MVIGDSSLSQDGLFAAEAVERIDPVVDANQRVDTNSGINKWPSGGWQPNNSQISDPLVDSGNAI